MEWGNHQNRKKANELVELKNIDNPNPTQKKNIVIRQQTQNMSPTFVV